MKKVFEKYTTEKDKEIFTIEEDLPEVGWYLLRTDSKGNQTHDYLQDTLKDAIDFAKSEFMVATNKWTKVEIERD